MLPLIAKLRGQVPPSFSFDITNVIVMIIIMIVVMTINIKVTTSCTNVRRFDSGSSLKETICDSFKILFWFHGMEIDDWKRGIKDSKHVCFVQNVCVMITSEWFI